MALQQSGYSPMKSFNIQGPGFWESLGNFFTGTPERVTQLAKFGPEQEQALSQILQQALGGLSNNQFDFAPIEQQARTGFQQKTLPSIAERFTSMGSQGSSAFRNALGQAGAGLEENLASMKQQYNLQREPLLQNMFNMGVQPRFESAFTPRQPGFFQNALGGLAGGGQGGQGGQGDLMATLMKLLPYLAA